MKKTLRFCLDLIKRYIAEEYTTRAASLVYVSILALVPSGVLIFTFISALELPDELGNRLQKFLLDYLVTDSITQVDEILQKTWSQARKFSWLNFGILLFSVITFLRNIDNCIQSIWKIKKSRPLYIFIPICCLTIFLGPIFLGGSLLLSATLFAHNQFLESFTFLPGMGFMQSLMLEFLPFALTFLGFFSLNKLLPYTCVHWKNAAVGAIFASIALELSKFGFGNYVLYSTTYKNLYGILAIIPIFLLWLYILWNIVLFSVMISHSMQSMQSMQFVKRQPNR